MRFATLLAMLFAATAAAAPCSNCDGHRVVGPGPVLYACPICEGTGTTPEMPPAPGLAAAAPEPDPEPAMMRALPIQAEPAPPVRGRPRPVVARIESATGPSLSCGSGVLVAASGTQAIVLTNWHVVRGSRHEVRVYWPDGSKSPARVVASDDAWDLAALVVARPSATPVTIAATAPRIGEPLTIAGYGPPPYRYREQRGPVTQYASPTNEHPEQFVELQATARQGDSGGPIFDARGELAGVLFGTRSGHTIGPCSTRLRAFLAGVHWPDTCPDGRCAKR